MHTRRVPPWSGQNERAPPRPSLVGTATSAPISTLQVIEIHAANVQCWSLLNAFVPRQPDGSEPKSLQGSHEYLIGVQIARLNEVAVSSKIVATGDVCFGSGRSKYDNRNMTKLFIILQDAKNLTAIFMGAIKVEQNERTMLQLRITSVPTQHIHGLDAIFCR